MSKDQINQFDSTAANNTDIEGINTSETMVPSAVNNSIRSLMSLLKKQDVGTHAMTSPNIDGGTVDGANITVGSGKTLDVSAGTLTLANDQISGDKINGGTITSTFSGNLTGDVTGNASGTAATVTTAAQPAITSVGNLTSLNIVGTTTSDFLVIQTNEDSAGTAPDVTLYRNSASPADNDYVGKIEWRANNSAAEATQYAYMAAQTIDVTDGTEDGRLVLVTKQNGADTTSLTLDADGATFPQDVGIGATAASGRLHVTNTTGTIGYFESSQASSNVSNLVGNATQTSSSANLVLQINGGTQAQALLRCNGDNSMAFFNGASPTEKMRLLSGGELSVGTTSGTGMINATASSWSKNCLYLNSATTGGGQADFCGIGMTTAGTASANIYTDESHNFSITRATGGNFYLKSGSAGISGGTTQLTVADNGNVGIGVTPTIDSALAGLSIGGKVLHVHDGSGASLKLSDAASGANRGVGLANVGVEAALVNCEAGDFRFGTGNQEKMRIDHSSGGVAIGSTAASELLHLSGSNCGMRLEEPGGFDWRINNDGGSLNFSSDDPSAWSDKLTITNDGKVGIGVAPSDPLHLYKAAADTTLRLQWDATHAGKISFREGSTETGQIEMHSPTDGDQAGNMKIATLSSGAGGKAIVFQTNSAEAMRIASDGKVGIGGAPGSNLHVFGGSFTLEHAGNTTLYTKNSTTVDVIGGIQALSNQSVRVGSVTAHPTEIVYQNAVKGTAHNTGFTVNGALAKTSGSFKIDHPLPEKTDNYHLVHSFIEGPQADLIYRGRVDLVNGEASINIDTASGMTDGTFVLLNRDVQCFTSNETGWTAVRGAVDGNILSIEAQDNTCTDTISWMVVGERHDPHMYDTDWTDEEGKVIVEPLKPDDPFNSEGDQNGD